MSPGLTRILLALTFVTGIVDAVSFLGLGQVFAAMQTGNVVFLGFGLGGAAGAPVAAPLIALGAFLCGGALAALLLRPTVPGHSLGTVLAVEVPLLLAALGVAVTTEVEAGHACAYALIALLSLAMGLRNTAVRGLGGPNLATTVLNLTLTSLTAPVPALASGDDLAQRGAAFLAILAGAATGALLLKTSLALPIAAAAAIAAAAGVAHLRLRQLPA